jgi:hypothetical protein
MEEGKEFKGFHKADNFFLFQYDNHMFLADKFAKLQQFKEEFDLFCKNEYDKFMEENKNDDKKSGE